MPPFTASEMCVQALICEVAMAAVMVAGSECLQMSPTKQRMTTSATITTSTWTMMMTTTMTMPSKKRCPLSLLLSTPQEA
jgi:hypothetical protein